MSPRPLTYEKYTIKYHCWNKIYTPVDNMYPTQVNKIFTMLSFGLLSVRLKTATVVNVIPMKPNPTMCFTP